MQKKIVEPNLFIFANPRSGSTLLCALLCQHSEVCCLNDTFIFDRYVYTKGTRSIYQINNDLKYAILSTIKPLPSNNYIVSLDQAKRFIVNLLDRYEINASWNPKDSWTRKYATMIKNSDILSQISSSDRTVINLFNIVYSQLITPQQANQKIFGEKTPVHLYLSAWIRRLYPKAKFVTLIRNPITNVASIHKRNKNKDIDSSINWYLKAYKNRFNYLYKQENNLIIRYEDLIYKTEKTLELIHKYIEVNPETNNYNKFNDITNKGYTGNYIDPNRDIKLKEMFEQNQIKLIKKRCKHIFEKFYFHELE